MPRHRHAPIPGIIGPERRNPAVDGEGVAGEVREPAYLEHGVESLVAMDNPDDAQPTPSRPEVERESGFDEVPRGV